MTEMSVNAMQKHDGPIHMLRYCIIIFLLRFSLCVLHKHNSKVVNFQSALIN